MKTNRIGLLVLFFSFFFFIECKDRMNLNSDNYAQHIVVDGFITNEPGPYLISISKSSTINTKEIFPYSDCIVSITDNTGYSEKLEEKEPGRYYTSPSGIKGVIGNKYAIRIETPDRNVYESDFQEMMEPVEIDSLYADFIYKETEEYPEGIPGYQFYTDSKEASNKYYLWKMEESYEYTSDFRLYALLSNKGIKINGLDTITGYDTLYRCWKNDNIASVYAGTTFNLSVPKITSQPLIFVSSASKRLTNRYSLLLKQYSIDKKAFYFWKKIQEQTQNKDFLSAKIPYNIVGNITNIKNPADQILGFFTVGSIKEKRVFVSAPRVPFYFDKCYVSYNFEQPISIFLVMTADGIAIVKKNCIDCTSEGGETRKPSFWKE